MPARFPALAFAIALLACSVCLPGCPGPRRALSPVLGPSLTERLEASVFEAVNRERKAYALSPLQPDPDLAFIARAHSLDMVRMEKLSHAGTDGRTVEDRATRHGVDWWHIGENIARNRGYTFPADKAVKDWMQSPPHRANILNKLYRHTGVGVAEGENGNIYFTQVFMRPMPE